jgi:general secretion pathway protein J
MRGARARGFTLVELLAALAVIGVLAVAGYRALATLLDAEAHIDAQTRRWTQVAQLLAQMERDVSLAAARPVRDASGATQPALLAAGGLLALTRFGDEGAAGAQAAPRRVGYRLREGTLEYLVWPSLDGAASPAAAFPVLENVAAFRVAARDAAGAPLAQWPLGNPAALPRALHAELVLESGERLTRTFLLR